MRQLVGAMLLAVVFVSVSQTRPQTPPTPAVYGQYPERQQYSPLSQINAKNVQRLRVAWTYDIGDRGGTFEATPIVVNNVMYFPTPQSHVVALNALTGQKMWEFNPHPERTRVSRGVAYWPGDAHNPPRILFGTSDGRLIALDAKTGQLIPGFGDQGEVDVRKLIYGNQPGGFGYTSPPAVLNNTVILSPFTQEGPSHGVVGNGDPRAFDVVTGKQVWQFHTLPSRNDKEAKTWGGPKNVTDRSGPSAWVPNAVDPVRNMVFVITGNPADSYYGADRPGDNLYSNSVVALDGATGKLRWDFQTVHHDVWDFDGVDVALIEVHRDGKTIPAVVGLDKDSSLFILDEMTGKPIYRVQERRVPKSDVPGEVSSPTQPFPLGPPPLSRVSMSTADLTDVTPESAQYCKQIWSEYHNDGAFTPFGTTPTVIFPSTIGGPNWDSISFDPGLGYIFVTTSEMGGLGQMKKASEIPARRFPGRGRSAGRRGPSFGQPAQFQMPYRNAMATARFVDPDGYPCQKPPWGLLTAVNANTGKIAWKVTLGDYGKIQETGMSKAALTSLPEGPGKDEVQAACTTCHGISSTLQQRNTREGWMSVVNTMVGLGMHVTNVQKEDIINYLARFLGEPAGAAPTNAPSQAEASSAAPSQTNEPTGTPNLGGNMSTAGGLVFVGATLDNKFRAFDAKTGKQLWSFQLDGVGYSTPMSFMGTDGKQYVAIASGGPGLLRAIHNDAGNSPNKIVVFTLAP
jgi:glucose dehydrogenase